MNRVRRILLIFSPRFDVIRLSFGLLTTRMSYSAPKMRRGTQVMTKVSERARPSHRRGTAVLRSPFYTSKFLYSDGPTNSHHVPYQLPTIIGLMEDAYRSHWQTKKFTAMWVYISSIDDLVRVNVLVSGTDEHLQL